MLVTALMVAFATLHEGDGFSTDCTARATEDVVLHVDHYIVEGKGFAISTSVCVCLVTYKLFCCSNCSRNR